MKPTLFTVFNHPVYSYGFFIVLGLLLATFGFSVVARREKISVKDSVYMMMLVFVCGMAGAKIISIAAHPEKFSGGLKGAGVFFFVSRQGFSFHGALFGAILGLWLFSREVRVPFIRILDMAAPFGALAYAVGRLGCFFNGCCVGVKTQCILGVSFLQSAYLPEPKTQTYHPVQLYDSFLNVCLFMLLLETANRKKYDGQVFLLYVMLYSVIRFFIDFLRAGVSGKVEFLFFTQAQLLSVVVFAMGFVFMKKFSEHSQK